MEDNKQNKVIGGGSQFEDAERHYNESRASYLKALGGDEDVGGESHIGYYRDKYPENYKVLVKGPESELDQALTVSVTNIKEVQDIIPDPNFRKALLDKNIGLKEDFSNLSVVAKNTEALVLSNYEIKDLKGIEEFQNLKKIDVRGLGIDKVDVSSNFYLDKDGVKADPGVKVIGDRIFEKKGVYIETRLLEGFKDNPGLVNYVPDSGKGALIKAEFDFANKSVKEAFLRDTMGRDKLDFIQKKFDGVGLNETYSNEMEGGKKGKGVDPFSEKQTLKDVKSKKGKELGF